MVIIDEPELGLHPYVITVLAGLLKSASERSQLLISTQSANLVDELEPQDIIVVDRKDGLGADIDSSRFIPYLQLHEYEALLFSDIEKFHHYYIASKKQLNELKKNVAGITNPELINENPDSAPSKRIIKFLPSYDGEKPSAGPIIAEHIGLQQIRLKCKHFNSWISQLESLNN